VAIEDGLSSTPSAPSEPSSSEIAGVTLTECLGFCDGEILNQVSGSAVSSSSLTSDVRSRGLSLFPGEISDRGLSQREMLSVLVGEMLAFKM